MEDRPFDCRFSTSSHYIALQYIIVLHKYLGRPVISIRIFCFTPASPLPIHHHYDEHGYNKEYLLRIGVSMQRGNNTRAATMNHIEEDDHEIQLSEKILAANSASNYTTPTNEQENHNADDNQHHHHTTTTTLPKVNRKIAPHMRRLNIR